MLVFWSELISQGRRRRQVEQAEQAAREAMKKQEVKFVDVLKLWIEKCAVFAAS
jgi:hypothetical protein